MENFGKRLRRLRKERGLTQDDIAAAIGVSRQIISRWERNEAVPKAGNLTALADTLGISADYLLHGKTNFPATPEIPVEVPLNEQILEIAELAEAVLETEEPNAPFLTVTSVPAPEVLSLLSENNFEEEIAESKLADDIAESKLADDIAESKLVDEIAVNKFEDEISEKKTKANAKLRKVVKLIVRIVISFLMIILFCVSLIIIYFKSHEPVSGGFETVRTITIYFTKDELIKLIVVFGLLLVMIVVSVVLINFRKRK